MARRRRDVDLLSLTPLTVAAVNLKP